MRLHSRFRSAALAGVALLLAAHASAQSTAAPLSGAQRSAWYMYFGDHPFTPSWGVHLEGQFRRADLGQRWEQLILRPGINYNFGHALTGLFAYTYQRNYPFEAGGIEASGPQPEHRILEQLQFSHRLAPGERPIRFTHRFRAEQRFLGSSQPGRGVTGWRYAERARYRLTANIPLRWSTAGARPDYVALYDEVFVNFGPHGSSHALNQNRTYGALGWELNKYVQLELGYLFQYMPLANGVVGQNNHALQVTITSKAPFRRNIGNKH